jgi:hypothetical protein
MKRGWAFEATSCPRDQTKLRKANYKFTLRPSHVLYILLPAVRVNRYFNNYSFVSKGFNSMTFFIKKNTIPIHGFKSVSPTINQVRFCRLSKSINIISPRIMLQNKIVQAPMVEVKSFKVERSSIGNVSK